MIPEVSLRSAPSAPPTVDDDARALWKWIGILAQAWVLLAVGAVAGGLLGWFAASRSASMFEAVATVAFQPPPQRTTLFTAAGMRSVFTGATVVSRVVSELSLDREPFALTPDAFRSRALIVEEVPTTNLLRLRVRLSDPETAAKAATAVAREGSELTARAWRDAAISDEAILEKQLTMAREELTKAEQRWLDARLAGERPASGAAAIRIPRPVSERDRRARGLDQKSLEDRLAESGNAAAAGGAGDGYTKQFELLRLENEVEVKRELFMELADQLGRVRLEVAGTPTPLRLLEPATAPKYPLAGTGKRTIALGVLAGFVLAACVVVAREWRLAARR
jgi:uncharacterized protein involved in exopolysaccharide biosynthesis